MANNLHISYDLNSPGQNYSKVIEAIKSLGNWAKINESFWYVNSTKTAEQACDIIYANMDYNDELYVVDSTNNEAYWRNLSDEVSKHIQDNWSK